jgi:Cd2+/Zn2+-exporting ATPase
VFPLGDRRSEDILILAASIEQRSEHPLAKAVTARARQSGLGLLLPDNFLSVAGHGARADLGGVRYLIGNIRYLAESGVPVEKITGEVERLQSSGQTVMVLGTLDEPLGLLAVADEIRETVRTMVRELKALGVKTVMLTGDNRATARSIAIQAGIDEYHAELLPKDKVKAVRELLDKYGRVAMVGDGINDAPALAAATVAMAMGGAGTDVAMETADIVFMGDDLSKLPFSMRLSRSALRVIKQNISFALVVKVLAVLLVFPGWLTLWLAILADMGASVAVTLNGIRLLGIKPR